MEEKILTVDEVARLKTVSRSTIYAAVSADRLPHVRLLGRIGIREEDAAAWVPMTYAGRPGARGSGGRPSGKPMTEAARARISAAQKRRWAIRKQESPPELLFQEQQTAKQNAHSHPTP